jgi:surface antigen
MTTKSAPTRRLLIATLAAGVMLGAPALARAEMLNCVQFVQRVSPVALHGDAYEWWDAADGHYGRGNRPAAGSVMVFAKSHHLPHGHVAVVQKQLDDRTILVDHANWSRFAGHRGRVERAVRVVDVSEQNDWSLVRVWYHSLADVGQTVYSLRGFVYPRTRAPSRHHPRHHGR